MYTQRYFIFFDEPELIQAARAVTTRGHGVKIGGRYLSSTMWLIVQEEEMRRYRSLLSEMPKKLAVQRIIEELVNDEMDGEDFLDIAVLNL